MSATDDVTAPLELEGLVVKLATGRVVRLTPGKEEEAVEAGGTIINMAFLADASLEEIAALYSNVVGVSPKKFKDREVATQSLIYQINKKLPLLPTLPSVVEQTPVGAPSSNGTATAAQKSAPAAKHGVSIQVIRPDKSEELLKALPPQARVLMEILTEMAVATGSTVVSVADFDARLQDKNKEPLLETTQPPLRIFSYYRKRLTEDGFIKVQ